MSLVQHIGGLVVLLATVLAASVVDPSEDELSSLKGNDPASYEIVEGLLKKHNMGLLNYRHPSQVGLPDEQGQSVSNSVAPNDSGMDPQEVHPAAEEYAAEVLTDHDAPQPPLQ